MGDERASGGLGTLGGPKRLALLEVEAVKTLARLVDDATPVYGKHQALHRRHLAPPKHLAAPPVHGKERRGLLVAPAAAFGGLGRGLGKWIAGVDQHDPLTRQQFPDRRSLLNCGEDFARRSVEDAQRALEGKRGVNAIAVGHDAALILFGNHRTTAADQRPILSAKLVGGPLRPTPGGNRLFPQQATVEGVAADKRPSLGQSLVDNADQAFVEIVEKPPRGRDHGLDARRGLVTAQPQRRSNPLQRAGGSNGGIPGHRVVARVMEIMRPVVDALRARLDRLGPGSALANAGDAAGDERAKHLVQRHRRRFLDHHEVDEVVDIGKPRAKEPLDGNRAVESPLGKIRARSVDFGRVRIEPVDRIALTRAECRQETSVAAPEVNHQSPLDSGGFQNRLQDLLRCAGFPAARRFGSDGNKWAATDQNGEETDADVRATAHHGSASRGTCNPASARFPRSAGPTRAMVDAGILDVNSATAPGENERRTTRFGLRSDSDYTPLAP